MSSSSLDVNEIQIQLTNETNALLVLSTYLDEELDLGANVDQIQVGVEAEDVDAAAGAPGVEYDGVLLTPGGGGGAVQGPGPPGRGSRRGGGGGGGRSRHEEEDEGDER